MSLIIWKDNDVAIEWEEMKDLDGNYINTATVTLESLVDKLGVAVTGITPPVSMPFVVGSNGRYRAILPHTLGVTLGEYYTGVVKAVSGSMDGNVTVRMICRKRLA